jgi:hypothetical protein
VSEPDDEPPPPPPPPEPPEPPAEPGPPEDVPPQELYPPPPQEPGPPQDVPPQELYPPPLLAFGAEMPLVPHDASLTDAVGVPSASARRRKAADERLGRETDDDGEPITKRSRRTTIIIAVSVIGGLSIAGLVFLGHANAERYAISCESSKVIAEQGRGFPPWGTHPMAGPEWKPIQLPTNAECKPRETEELDELGSAYLAILIDRASATLTAKNPVDAPVAAAGQQAAASPLDVATEQLDQALLLARSPERRDQRKEIERLLGDVDYWRASMRLRDASAALLDAAKQFDTAAAQRPRHVTDAAAWGTYLRHLADELHAGPNSAPSAPSPLPAGSTPTPAVPAPVGTALPVEPEPEGSAAPAVDAGVPSGGVLL